jgi:hypothetical protein
VYNCTPDSQDHTLTWTDTTSSTVGTGGDLTLKGGFLTVFEAAVRTTFSYSWTQSKTYSESYKMSLRPHWVGWTERAPALDKVTGRLDVRYWGKVAGKREWSVPDLAVSGPSREGRGTVFQQARPMTAAEKASRCIRKGGADKGARAAARVVASASRMDPASSRQTVVVPAPAAPAARHQGG